MSAVHFWNEFLEKHFWAYFNVTVANIVLGINVSRTSWCDHYMISMSWPEPCVSWHSLFSRKSRSSWKKRSFPLLWAYGKKKLPIFTSFFQPFPSCHTSSPSVYPDYYAAVWPDRHRTVLTYPLRLLTMHFPLLPSSPSHRIDPNLRYKL